MDRSVVPRLLQRRPPHPRRRLRALHVAHRGRGPSDMFRQIKGEGLNVGSVLTWGPGFDHQKQFFAPLADKRSEPLTLMKYDIEVSGFGSEALGHVCLLNLKEQIYPGPTAARTGRPGRCRCCAGPGRKAGSAAMRIRAAVCKSIPRRRPAACSTARQRTGTGGSTPARPRAASCQRHLPTSTPIATARSARPS